MKLLITGVLLAMLTANVQAVEKVKCDEPDANGVKKCTEKNRLGFKNEFWVKKIFGREYRYEEYPGLESKPTPYNWN